MVSQRQGTYEKETAIALVGRTIAMFWFLGPSTWSSRLPPRRELNLVVLLTRSILDAIWASIQLRDLVALDL